MAKIRLFRRLSTRTLFTIGFSALLTLLIILSSIKDNYDYQLSCQVMKQVVNSNNTQVRPIIFTESSGRAHLSYRTACSIESAAFHHPNWPVILYNISALANDTVLQHLLKIPNFRLESIELNQLFAHTPLNDWYSSGIYRLGPFRVEKLSDALRLVLLWKMGGIYLDTDIIVLNSMANLRNAIGLETLYKVNGAVLIFDRHSDFLYESIQEFQQHYSPLIWGAEGPSLLTKIITRTCMKDNFISKLYQLTSVPKLCRGLSVLPYHSFYPIPWSLWPKLFSVVSDYQLINDCSYTVHLWNSMSKVRTTELGSRQLLDTFAQQNCPKLYQLMIANRVDGL